MDGRDEKAGAQAIVRGEDGCQGPGSRRPWGCEFGVCPQGRAGGRADGAPVGDISPEAEADSRSTPGYGRAASTGGWDGHVLVVVAGSVLIAHRVHRPVPWVSLGQFKATISLQTSKRIFGNSEAGSTITS